MWNSNWHNIYQIMHYIFHWITLFVKPLTNNDGSDNFINNTWHISNQVLDYQVLTKYAFIAWLSQITKFPSSKVGTVWKGFFCKNSGLRCSPAAKFTSFKSTFNPRALIVKRLDLTAGLRSVKYNVSVIFFVFLEGDSVVESETSHDKLIVMGVWIPVL